MKNNQLKNKNSAFTLIELSIVLIIIVLVVIAIVAASAMVRAAKLSQARSMTSSSPVAQIENLAMWLETTSEKSFDKSEIINESPVSVWYDINPQGVIKNNFVASGSNRPVFIKNAIEGLPGIKFDGDDDFMQNTIAGVVGNITSEATWFVVFQLDATSKTQTFMSIEQSGQRFAIAIDSNNVFSQLENNDYVSADPTTDFLNKPYILSVTRKITNSPPVSIFLNSQFSYDSGNSNFDSPSKYDGVMDKIGGTNTVIGNWINNNDESVSGYILEMIVYNRALTDIERQNVENYLNKKWGVGLSLN